MPKSTRDFTSKEVAAFLNSDGCACPVCGGTTRLFRIGDPSMSNPPYVYQSMGCDCGARYTEEYKLSGVKRDHEE